LHLGWVDPFSPSRDGVLIDTRVEFFCVGNGLEMSSVDCHVHDVVVLLDGVTILVRDQSIIDGGLNQLGTELLVCADKGTLAYDNLDLSDMTIKGGVSELLFDEEVIVIDDILLEGGNGDHGSLLGV
jgi:hypothetical protein